MTSVNTEISPHLMNEVTTGFINVVSSSSPGVTRAAGLLTTHNDMKALRHFAEYANRLPHSLDQVKQLLGYAKSGVAGLEPEDIQKLYRIIRDTAEQWPHLEINMKIVSSQLVVFADNLKSVGNDVIEFIQGLDSYKSAEGVVGDYENAKLDSLPHSPLLSSDANKVSTLYGFIKELTDLVDEQKKEAANVKDKIIDYKYELTDLAAKVGLKRQLCLTTANTTDSTELNEQIDALNTQIEEQRRTYETYSRYIWVGLWWGPVGLAISASIYGTQASDVWGKVELLMSEKNELSLKVRSNQVANSLMTLETNLQELSLRIDGAVGGAANLEELWLLIHQYITSSIERFKKTNNATLLTIFVSRLTNLISNWQEIKIKSQSLLSAFEYPAEQL